MKVSRKALETLLSATRREQYVNGKAQAQVTGCILRYDGEKTSTISVVKDGKTSLGHFSFKGGEGDETSIPVPDIDRMSGVLKYHSDTVKLTYISETGKVVVKSPKKQTTIVGGEDAKAFANSQKSLIEWEIMSNERAEQISPAGVYTLKDGSIKPPFLTAVVSSDELYSALKCDAMNGQKLNRYKFKLDNSVLSVTVGDHFKGLTESELVEITGKDFEISFEGGLEYIIKHYNGDVKLHFLDFTPEGQTICLILGFANGDWVVQWGVFS